MPRWGQLGCQGFIILDSSGAVVRKTTPAFMQVETLAFKYVEMVLSALLEAKPIPDVGPGVIVRIKDSSPLNGTLAICLEDADAEGNCLVSLRDRRSLRVKQAQLGVAYPEDDIGSDGGCCEGGAKECAKEGDKDCDCAEKSCVKEDCTAAVEAAAEKLKQASLAVKDGAHLPADVLQSLQAQMVAAKGAMKDVLADAKRKLPADDEFIAKFSINGPCTNTLCLCPICECGATCQCNVAAVETCEQCTEFRAQRAATKA